MNFKVINNILWRLLERFAAQGVTLVVSIVLARLLGPDAYGIVAIVTVITSILQIFLDGGFGVALVQKKDADELDFSSVFYFNVAFGILLYAFLFFCAPVIAFFFHMPELTKIVRVLGLTLIAYSLKSVQQAYVSKTLQFKKFFWATLGGTVGAAIIGIALAYFGYGVWALVIQHLFNTVLDTIILWIVVGWRPNAMFSLERLKALLTYGWKIFVSGLLDMVYTDSRQLIIGKMYSSTDLAYYNQGQRYTQVMVTNINASIDSVLLPTMAMVQDDAKAVKQITRRAIAISTYVIMPIMVGIAVCAEPIIRIVLTEKWSSCVPYMRVFCFTYAFFPIHTANLNAIKAMGKSDIYLKLEVIKKIIGFLVLFITIGYGPLVMAYSLLGTSVLNQVINSWPNKELINYSYSEQIIDICPQTLLALVMGIVVYSITFLGLSDGITLSIQIPLGVIFYTMGSKLLHIDSFDYILSLVKEILEVKSNNSKR